MTAIYPPACQGMERGEPSYWDGMVAGEEESKLETCTLKGRAQSRAASGHSAHWSATWKLTTPYAVIVQANGHEAIVWQPELADHSKGADIPRQDCPIQTTGVDLTVGGSNTHVCI